MCLHFELQLLQFLSVPKDTNLKDLLRRSHEREVYFKNVFLCPKFPPCFRVGWNSLMKIFQVLYIHSVYSTCETWSLTRREERKLRVFENMVLWRIFGPRRDEVTGEWRRLHNEELNDLYSSPNIVQVIKSIIMRWVGHVARMGEERGVHRFLVGKPEGRRPLGRPRCRWVDNIRLDLQEVGCGYMD